MSPVLRIPAVTQMGVLPEAVLQRRSAEWCLNAVNQCWTQKAARFRATELEAARQAYDHARRGVPAAGGRSREVASPQSADDRASAPHEDTTARRDDGRCFKDPRAFVTSWPSCCAKRVSVFRVFRVGRNKRGSCVLFPAPVGREPELDAQAQITVDAAASFAGAPDVELHRGELRLDCFDNGVGPPFHDHDGRERRRNGIDGADLELR